MMSFMSFLAGRPAAVRTCRPVVSAGGRTEGLAAEVVEPAVKELAAQFEKSTGNKLNIERWFWRRAEQARAGRRSRRRRIFPNGLIRTPATQAVLAPDTTTQLLRIGQGVAVKKGAPKPDISTPDAFKQTLLKATSVAFVPTGQSGVATLKVFEKLGIADEMKAKTKAQKVEHVVPADRKGRSRAGALPQQLSHRRRGH